MKVIGIPKNSGQEKRSIKNFLEGFLHKKQARRFARRTNRAIRKTFEGFGQEAKETRDMAKLFYRMLEEKLHLQKRKDPPTADEVKEAIEQLKDIGRISVFATISIIPGGGFSLIGLELLARKFGIRQFTFIPSAFQRKNRIFKPRSFGTTGKKQSLPGLMPEQKTRDG